MKERIEMENQECGKKKKKGGSNGRAKSSIKLQIS
jgi:hypothetical protein